MGGLEAGAEIESSWTGVATESEDSSLEVVATGLVSGSLGVWKDYPEYDYTDEIGGSATAAVSVLG